MVQAADFFVSYTSVDRAWAEWIAWQLEAEGYQVVVQAWDFRPGGDFVQQMHQAVQEARQTIAVLSPAYLTSAFGAAEWGAVFAEDPTGERGRLLPVRVEQVEPTGLLRARVYVNLVDQDAAGARGALLAAARRARGKPATEPEFPGGRGPSTATAAEAPRFPGELPPKATLVLSSTSPARQQLLRTIGWTARKDYFPIQLTVPPKISKKISTVKDARKLAEDMARWKIEWLRTNSDSDEVNDQLPSGWQRAQTILIGVDTIVFCQDAVGGPKVLDRPLLMALVLAGPRELAVARERAKEMLLEESGRTIHVITGLAVAIMGSGEEPTTRAVTTKAKLRGYSKTDIESYISSFKPFDKAGAFGIQDAGVSLFEGITGSYTNVVGLPLREFVELLEQEYGNTFTLPERSSPLALRESPPRAGDREPLSVVCVGDINYDFVYDGFPPRFFSDLAAPGGKVMGPIRRAVGGTAVNFAKGAKEAGFSRCSVVGVVGGDALGRDILSELRNLQIKTISPRNPGVASSIAIILRSEGEKDISLTLTDAHQWLPAATVKKAETSIKESDVVYCSGYCLTDRNRSKSALDILSAAKEANCTVVLDVVVDMMKVIQPIQLERSLQQDGTRLIVDVVVAEMPEIFGWFGVAMDGKNEIETWNQHEEELVGRLRERFPVTILRTRSYTHEIVITPDRVDGPNLLDYGELEPEMKTGYGDVRTANQVHSFLSPRIVLASKSPQRLELLRQIVAPSKIQVVTSMSSEEVDPDESPEARVMRVAQEKAEWVLAQGGFHDDIELIIGADTEIVRRGARGQWRMIGHPTTPAKALRDLRGLNNGDHEALTGLAVIGRDPKAEPGQLKRWVGWEKTTVTFIKAGEEQLRAYADTGEPIGRAGAYAIQGLGTMLIERVDGSYSNVVGLPLEKLSQVLAEEFDKPIWRFDKVSNWCLPDPIKGLR
ncbi:MAG TPA: Maf family nucleotide pyrophosphatase [Actinomycetes bacterium]|nr:Maf family nucleotide pyrophosphatase [Actinomycetes bacterium]